MGEFGPEIETGDLRRDDVPEIDPASDDAWSVFTRFALTFDGYARLGQQCAVVANRSAGGAYRESGRLPEDADVLRACLFYEQRRWRHFDVSPGPNDWTYLCGLLSQLRSSLQE